MRNKIKAIIGAMVAIVSGVFGAIGGAGKKGFRRFGIAMLLAIAGCLIGKSFIGLLAGLLIIPASIGYGIPDASDKGSALGCFWYRICGQRALAADILTRTTIGLILASIGALMAYFRGNWAILGLVGPGLTLSWSLTPVLWNKLGTFKLFGRQLLWGECVLWTITAGLIWCQLIL